MRHSDGFGEVEGVKVGKWWPNRQGLVDAGVHLHREHGISGRKGVGARSVVMSGGSYYQDEDYGDRFVYVGSGGFDKAKGVVASEGKRRRQHEGKQTADQSFANASNQALLQSDIMSLPVRVIRGKGSSKWAPDHGYRYDGLYYVTNSRLVQEPSGFKVCKFDFERMKPQHPLVDYKGPPLGMKPTRAPRKRTKQEGPVAFSRSTAGPSNMMKEQDDDDMH
ncbi:PUA-like domain-containing protein [Cytidiella melzeri]|nr:PUA-like domain-containing protein [Cytidiella melzeri]